ncbi:hypothetical protein Glove_137g70 [Diversispora epigaea]|uniref:Uncharacterized protein n=1 Tax=Diversispora epigaea TaxID=1348612 RepID=A0A397J512_9GLOM|nr:hypothetical protein Glove_137g70 [Diversispora epigaea]
MASPLKSGQHEVWCPQGIPKKVLAAGRDSTSNFSKVNRSTIAAKEVYLSPRITPSSGYLIVKNGGNFVNHLHRITDSYENVKH